jgi:hypothetical protein
VGLSVRRKAGEPPAQCSFVSDDGQECDKRVLSRGLCGGHYGQQNRGEHLHALRPRRPNGVTFLCAFERDGEQCPNTSRTSAGLCAGHDQQRRRGESLSPLAPRSQPNKVRIEGEIAHLTLTDTRGRPCGEVAIDTSDLALVAGTRWHLHRTETTGYAAAAGGILLHRIIMGVPDPAVEVDHVDGRGLWCLKSNLRLVSRAENAQNVCRAQRGRDMRNVHWNRRDGHWMVRVRRDGRVRCFGQYDNVDEAKGIARMGRAAMLTHANEERHTGAAEPAPEAQPALFPGLR